jgi:hypothetical protein
MSEENVEVLRALRQMPGKVASWWQSRQSGNVLRILLSAGSPVDVMDLERDV